MISGSESGLQKTMNALNSTDTNYDTKNKYKKDKGHASVKKRG